MDNDIKTMTCSYCYTEKPMSDFGVEANRLPHRIHRCKVCMAAIQRQRRISKAKQEGKEYLTRKVYTKEERLAIIREYLSIEYGGRGVYLDGIGVQRSTFSSWMGKYNKGELK